MAHHARIFEEGVFAFEDVVVGSADPDMADRDAGFACFWTRRRIAIDDLETARFNTQCGLHAYSFRLPGKV
jgi:hypothetical protein